MQKIYLEDTWNEEGDAEDIINYANNKKIQIEIKTVTELYDINSTEFINNIYFCNTDIVQYHLCKMKKEYLILDTYEHKYKKYYGRDIELVKFSEFLIKYNCIL